jgi:hypothetical protein
VAFISIITAIITTTFITRARIELQAGAVKEAEGTVAAGATAIDARFDVLEQKLDALEAAIRESSKR